MAQSHNRSPRTNPEWEAPSSDAVGHYDIDGVSYAFGRVIVASQGNVPFDELWVEPETPGRTHSSDQ